MSHEGEAKSDASLDFKWLTKKGVGGKKKDVRFYESFIYDGVEYTLYDDVYLYNESEPEPYIGKLIKIWEKSGDTKKVKVQWYFRVWEISKWLEDNNAQENELFFATGEGFGLANINPLEAIAGKCNVVCISKDCRNPQLSEDDIKKADYVFYRTFDVQSCTISDKIDDKVGGLESKFVFNRKGIVSPSTVPEIDSNKQGTHEPSNKSPIANSDGNKDKSMLLELETQGQDSLVNNDNNSPPQTGKSTRSDFGFGKDVIEVIKTSTNQVETKQRTASVNDSEDLGDGPSKSAGVDNVPEEKKVKREKLPVQENAVKASNATVASKGKLNISDGDDSLGALAGTSLHKETGDMEGRPLKKLRVGSSHKLSEDKNDSLQKVTAHGKDNDVKVTSFEGKAKSKIAPDSIQLKKGLKVEEPDEKAKSKIALDPIRLKKGIKVEEPDDKIKRLSNGKLPKVSTPKPGDATMNFKNFQEFEVTRRPDEVKHPWLKSIPWEGRMKTAHERGTLVLLQNLDPGFTSEEVESIILHALNEACSAKMAQHNGISSPHSGQALVIFKTKEATEKVIKVLDEGCLMLSNGVPLVATSFSLPSLSSYRSIFYGHLVIDRARHQITREDEAVSTSHCSQSNTIEYDMAMEWCSLHSRTEICWKNLYEQQGKQLDKLKATLKRK